MQQVMIMRMTVLREHQSTTRNFHGSGKSQMMQGKEARREKNKEKALEK
jgi:hypothetical protein